MAYFTESPLEGKSRGVFFHCWSISGCSALLGDVRY